MFFKTYKEYLYFVQTKIAFVIKKKSDDTAEFHTHMH